MNTRQLQFIVAVLAFVVMIAILWRYFGPYKSAEEPRSKTVNVIGGNNVEVADSSSGIISNEHDDSGARNGADSDFPKDKGPLYQFAEAVAPSDTDENTVQGVDVPYKIQGRGSKAKILDADGKAIIEADQNVGIYGCSVSPNGEKIAVYYGDANYEIVAPRTGEKLKLPQNPPGENVLGFGSWHWIDNSTLLGVSGKTIPLRNDQVGTAREEPVISRSAFYSYDLKNRKLSEVELPPALRISNVSVNNVDESGKVQFWLEGREPSETDTNLRWFELRLKE